MTDALRLLSDHAVWVWLALGAVLLAAELATTSGYLLWPAGAAGATALATPLLHLDDLSQILAFSTLTIAATYVGRRVLGARRRQPDDSLNNKPGRLIGRTGRVSGSFSAGHGRVFVDGAEWAADMAAGAPDPEAGALVDVIEVSGSRLVVRPPGR